MGTPEATNGIDRVAEYHNLFRGKRLGLITGPSGVTADLISSVEALGSRYRLTALFAPEHGIWGEAQAGDSVETFTDGRTGLPVHSLYGAGKRISEETVRDVDMMVFDMQDAGVRFYTYLYTLADAMKSCAALGMPLVVLDRVNPLGGAVVSGAILEKSLYSAVGRYALPQRHGLTIGEFARFVNSEEKIGCELAVVHCGGWRRDMQYQDTGLPWVPPSPNLPTPETALCYAGMCLVEGTNLSEGRGTAKPFEFAGAPWINAEDLAQAMRERRLPGVLFRPVRFRPAFSKHAGELCCGVQLHIADRHQFDPIVTALVLLQEVKGRYGEFDWVRFGDGRYMADLLLGSPALRLPDFDAGVFLREQEAALTVYRAKRNKYLLY